MAVNSKSRDLSNRWTPQFWETVDQRSVLFREIKSRLDDLKRDAGADSYQKDLICQEVIFISLQLETARVRAFEEGILNIPVYTQMVNCLSGLLAKLGLEKKHTKAMDIKSYLKSKRVGMNTIVAQSGIYPSEQGVAFDLGFAVVRSGHPDGAKIAVEVSKDGGLTWEATPFLPVDGHFRRNHPWGFDRAYAVAASGWRFGINVSGFTKQFALWMESRA